MHKTLLLGAALLAGPAADAAIIHQTVMDGGGGPVFFSDLLQLPGLTKTGSTWVDVSGGTITWAEWRVEGQYQKYWWEEIGQDEQGNPQYYLNGNEYLYSNGCLISSGAIKCGNAGNFLMQLHNNKLRIDFKAPVSFNHCFPFTGVLNTDCAVIYDLFGASFGIQAHGPGAITLTIHDSAIAGAIPEPASWAMLIAGFGLVGAALRRRRCGGPGLPRGERRPRPDVAGCENSYAAHLAGGA
jgi:hypothetical protein